MGYPKSHAAVSIEKPDDIGPDPTLPRLINDVLGFPLPDNVFQLLSNPQIPLGPVSVELKPRVTEIPNISLTRADDYFTNWKGGIYAVECIAVTDP
jgi:hypothetical protein